MGTTISAWTMTPKTLTENCNNVKEVFLQKMIKEEQITQEQFDNMNEYAVVICEKTFFGKIWDRLWKDDNKAVKIMVVKVIE